MFPTTLRRAAAHAERSPLIKFVGRRSTPSAIDHTPQPHPASPTGTLPQNFTSSQHTSFSSYRDHAQQFGPLRKTIKPQDGGIGSSAGANLGSVTPPNGVFFDRSQLPARFRRSPLTADEIEAIESGGAALF